jgi:hypothetical protein
MRADFRARRRHCRSNRQMRPTFLFAALPLVCAAAGAADLTATEKRWLGAGWPVVRYAESQHMPLDIVVQPQSRPGDAPLAMGFLDGRCKLVLAMRGNPEAEATLQRIDPALLVPVVEAMFAHELGHCWRYMQGVWHTLPAGFVDDAPEAGRDRERQAMRETRREEGFADLVGLAWTHWRNPAAYARVHAWFEGVRADPPVPGSHHDTRAWLRLVRDPSAFAPKASPFEQARAPWGEGLSIAP